MGRNDDEKSSRRTRNPRILRLPSLSLSLSLSHNSTSININTSHNQRAPFPRLVVP